MTRSHIIDVQVVFQRKSYSGKAVLVENIASGESIWLPLSQIDIENNLTKGEVCEISVPTWLAEKKELA